MDNEGMPAWDVLEEGSAICDEFEKAGFWSFDSMIIDGVHFRGEDPIAEPWGPAKDPSAEPRKSLAEPRLGTMIYSTLSFQIFASLHTEILIRMCQGEDLRWENSLRLQFTQIFREVKNSDFTFPNSNTDFASPTLKRLFKKMKCYLRWTWKTPESMENEQAPINA